jgi:hypothetical protein
MPDRRIGQYGVDLAGEFVSALPGSLRGRTDARRQRLENRPENRPATGMSSPFPGSRSSPCPARHALGGDRMRSLAPRDIRRRRGPGRPCRLEPMHEHSQCVYVPPGRNSQGSTRCSSSANGRWILKSGKRLPHRAHCYGARVPVGGGDTASTRWQSGDDRPPDAR